MSTESGEFRDAKAMIREVLSRLDQENLVETATENIYRLIGCNYALQQAIDLGFDLYRSYHRGDIDRMGEVFGKLELLSEAFVPIVSHQDMLEKLGITMPPMPPQ